MENHKYIFLVKQNIQNKKCIEKIEKKKNIISNDDPFIISNDFIFDSDLKDEYENGLDPKCYYENGVRKDFEFQKYTIKKHHDNNHNMWIQKIEKCFCLSNKDERIIFGILSNDKSKMETYFANKKTIFT